MLVNEYWLVPNDPWRQLATHLCQREHFSVRQVLRCMQKERIDIPVRITQGKDIVEHSAILSLVQFFTGDLCLQGAHAGRSRLRGAAKRCDETFYPLLKRRVVHDLQDLYVSRGGFDLTRHTFFNLLRRFPAPCENSSRQYGGGRAHFDYNQPRHAG